MFKIYANDNLIYSPGDKTLPISQPKLTLEMGKAGSLDFQVPPMNPYYNQLGQLSTKISVREDDTNEIFRGRVLSNERDFYNIRSVFCEGDLTYLVDSVQKAEKFSGKTHDLFRKIITAHNARMTADKQFTVGTINVENRDIILTGQGEESGDEGPIDYKQIIVNSVVDNWNTTFDFIQNTLIDYEGGYLRTRHVNNVNYIDLLTDYGVTSEQEIRIDSNMLDFTESISPEELFTVLIPLGDNNLTIASVNGGSDELVDTAAVAKYGRIVRTNVFQNVTDPNTLLENGRRYLTNNVNVPITFTIQAVDLHLLNPDVQAFHVGDRVKIVSEFHNVTEYMICTKIEYDLENPGNTVYTFGNPKQTLTDRYRKDKRQSNDTYGSGGRGSGVAGAATDTWALVDGEVEGAVEEASENTEKQINESYDAWLKINKGNATIDLGTLYEKYKGITREELTQTGIQFNGVTGVVNIFSDHEKTGVDGLGPNETLHSKITVAMGQISSEVTRATEAEGTLSSRITQTESNISSLVQKTGIDSLGNNETLFSKINQNANSITSLVYKSGVDKLGNDETLFSKISQTASEISTLVKKTGVNELGQSETLYSKITQTADSITSEVTRATEAEGTLSSRITQTESNISSLVQKTGIDSLGNNETLFSKISQNADSITSLVYKAGVNELGEHETLFSKISQTESDITSLVSKAGVNELGEHETLYSKITQTATDIRLEVSQQYYGKKTGIEINDGGISLNGKTITATSGNFSVSSTGILSATGAEFLGSTIFGNSGVTISSNGLITVAGSLSTVISDHFNASTSIRLNGTTINSWDDIVPKFG